jgi:peptidoglycan/xylan/chitin deacetylase (PgdA/CDA1 family)
MPEQTSGPPRDMVGYDGRPPNPAWPGGARIAIALVVHYEAGAERAIGDGDATREPGAPPGWPPDRRDLAVETMYEYGARAGVWRLLDVFDEHGVPATFAACAAALERNPEAAQALRARGHEVMAHGWRWEEPRELSREEERARIRRAVESIARTTGERPLGWCCRYGASVNTRALLVEEGGFLYDSDSYADDLPYWTAVGERRHLVVPHSLANDDARYDWGAYGSPRDLETHLKAGFDRLYREGDRMMSIGLHTRLAGHPARAQALSQFIAYARSFPDVWFARRIDIARHWIATHP